MAAMAPGSSLRLSASKPTAEVSRRHRQSDESSAYPSWQVSCGGEVPGPRFGPVNDETRQTMIDRPEIGQPPLEQPEIQPPTPDRIGDPIPERPDISPPQRPYMPDDDPMEIPGVPLPSAPEVPDVVPIHTPPGQP